MTKMAIFTQRMVDKELRETRNALGHAAEDSQKDRAFLGIVHNHVEEVADDVKFVENAINQMTAVIDSQNIQLELQDLLRSIEVLSRKITDKALNEAQSKAYQDFFTKLQDRYHQLVDKVEKQIGARQHLLATVENHVDKFARHKRLIRRSTYRGVRYENRVTKSLEKAKKAIAYLLDVEIEGRINLIKNPPKNLRAPQSRYYGKQTRVEAMKGRYNEKQRFVLNAKV